MNQTGSLLVYGSHGVCKVLEEEQRIVNRKKITYLVLEPLGQEGTKFFVPTNNAAAMEKLRQLLRPEEWETLLESCRCGGEGWIADENRRKQLYRELIGSPDRKRLLETVCSLLQHKEAQMAAGRKCHICDENFLRDAERIICGEIAVVMSMEPEAARAYLRQKMK